MLVSRRDVIFDLPAYATYDPINPTRVEVTIPNYSLAEGRYDVELYWDIDAYKDAPNQLNNPYYTGCSAETVFFNTSKENIRLDQGAMIFDFDQIEEGQVFTNNTNYTSGSDILDYDWGPWLVGAIGFNDTEIPQVTSESETYINSTLQYETGVVLDIYANNYSLYSQEFFPYKSTFTRRQ